MNLEELKAKLKELKAKENELRESKSEYPEPTDPEKYKSLFQPEKDGIIKGPTLEILQEEMPEYAAAIIEHKNFKQNRIENLLKISEEIKEVEGEISNKKACKELVRNQLVETIKMEIEENEEDLKLLLSETDADYKGNNLNRYNFEELLFILSLIFEDIETEMLLGCLPTEEQCTKYLDFKSRNKELFKECLEKLKTIKNPPVVKVFSHMQDGKDFREAYETTLNENLNIVKEVINQK